MSTATPTTATPAMDDEPEIDSFGLSLPDHWFVLPVERPEFDATVDGLRRAWRERGMNRTEQRRCELLLQRVRGQLRDESVLMAAATIEQGVRPGVADEAGNDETLAAVCTFSVLSRADLDTDVRLSIPVLFGAFGKRGPSNDMATITDLDPPQVCELASGRAVRLRRLYQLKASTSRLERWYGETYVTPVGTSGDVAGILQFCTTNVGLAGEFSSLFASYAETLTFFRPDDPTTMNTAPDPDEAP